LPNVFENGFSSIRKAAPPEVQEPEPFLKEPEPCQASPQEKARIEEQLGSRRGEWAPRGGRAWWVRLERPRPMPCGGIDARGPSVIGRPSADGWMWLAGRGRLLIMDWRLLQERETGGWGWPAPAVN
jgi:hypothetical protein